jgi:large repetitive protein
LSNMSVATNGINGGSSFLSISGDGNVFAWGGELWDNQATDGGRITIVDMSDPENWAYDFIYGTSFNHLGRSVSLNYDGTVMATLGGQNRIYKRIEGEWVNSYTIPESSFCTSLNAAGDMLAIGTNEFDNSESLNVGRMLVYGDLPNTPPTMDCPPNEATSNDVGMCGAVVEFSAINANDLEDGPLTSVQTGGLASGELFPLGSSTITFTATDSGGLSVACQYEIIVEDIEAPQAFCNNITAELDEDGNASISADEVNNASTENCEISTYELSTSDFSCEDLGISTVELTVTDAAGNQSVCPSIITVVDLIAPVAMCQFVNLDLGEDGTIGIEVEDLDNGSSDNCGFELTASMLEFDCGNLGQIPVVLTATDASGNSSTCSTEVTVSDATAPTMMCQDYTVSLDENGEGSLTLEDIDNGSFDNCLVALGMDIADFDCDDMAAPVEVTLTGTDFVGNQSTCTSMVTVVDEIAPTFDCPIDSVVQTFGNEQWVLFDYYTEGLLNVTD